MKTSVVTVFIALIIGVCSSSIIEVPTVRAVSDGCKSNFKNAIIPYQSTCTSLASRLTSLCLKVYLWQYLSATTMYLYINVAYYTMYNLDVYLGYSNPVMQATNCKLWIGYQISYLQYFSQCIRATGHPDATMVIQMSDSIIANLTLVMTDINSKTSSIFYNPLGMFGPPIYSLMNDTMLTMLTVSMHSCETFFTSCVTIQESYQTQPSIGMLMMNIVNSTTYALKITAQTVVQTTVSTSVSVTQTTVTNVINIQSTTMQSAGASCYAVMGVSKVSVASSYLILIGSMSSSSYDAGYISGAVADLEQANDDCQEETKQNVTNANAEFTEMTQNCSDAQYISDTICNVTQKITDCLVQASVSTSMTVQFCANIAISALLVTQTTGHQGIGKCVSDGKAENDKDVKDIQDSYKQSAEENQQNMTKCAEKHKDGPGPTSGSQDSGATSANQCESCKKKHCDKGKKHKEYTDEKCKKHKKGGENYEKVKKCKEDCRTSTVTQVTQIVAQFQICASVTIQM